MGTGDITPAELAQLDRQDRLRPELRGALRSAADSLEGIEAQRRAVLAEIGEVLRLADRAGMPEIRAGATLPDELMDAAVADIAAWPSIVELAQRDDETALGRAYPELAIMALVGARLRDRYGPVDVWDDDPPDWPVVAALREWRVAAWRHIASGVPTCLDTDAMELAREVIAAATEPVRWLLVTGNQHGVRAAEPDHVPDDVHRWASGNGYGEDRPEIYLLVAPADEPVSAFNAIATMEGALPAGEVAEIRERIAHEAPW